MIDVRDVEVVLEYLEEKRFSSTTLYLRNVIKAHRAEEYDKGCQDLANDLLNDNRVYVEDVKK